MKKTNPPQKILSTYFSGDNMNNVVTYEKLFRLIRNQENANLNHNKIHTQYTDKT